MMNDIFVYGTLMNDEIFNLLIGDKFEKCEASLNNYERVKVSGELYPAIRPKSNYRIEGVLVTGLSSEHLCILDKYEGELYERVSIVVDISEDEQHSCETYVFKEEYEYMLSNENWCNNTFRENHLKDYLQDHVA